MAKYVVLSFEDNDKAEAFVKAGQSLEEHLAVAAIDPAGGWDGAYEAQVEGMFQKPTAYCESGGRHEGTRVQGWSRGKKHGWWVCGTCGKPSPKWGQSLAAVIGCGVNQLRDRITQREEREEAAEVIEQYRTRRRMNIGNYPDGGAR
jgi:hypothetical protein